MNDTPQGDGNILSLVYTISTLALIRMNDTPQGDGNLISHLILLYL